MLAVRTNSRGPIKGGGDLKIYVNEHKNWLGSKIIKCALFPYARKGEEQHGLQILS